MKYLLTFLLLLNIHTLVAQSVSVADFQQEHATSRKFYLYPSTLRMVNLQENPDFYQLVSDVEKLEILLFDPTSVDRPAWQALQQSIQQEDYEELVSFRQKDSQITVYARGDSPHLDGVVGLVDSEQTLALVDLAGFIDLPALMNLTQGDFDFSPITKLVSLATESQEKGDEPPPPDEPDR